MNSFEKHLEKIGAKYILPMSMLFYATGAIVFNIYLLQLGMSEFEFLKLRYILIGISFALISSFLPISAYYTAIFWKKKNNKNQKVTKKSKTQIKKIIKLFIFALIIPWTLFYAIYIFPTIPSGFGGAKPIVARLIAPEATIKRINQMIAFESGVDVKSLPIEKIAENSDLFAGANIKILDRSPSRVFLLLTKDIYITTQSFFAKKLIENEGVKNLELDSTKNFKTKPLIINEATQGLTLSLYQPPAITTSEDLTLAKNLISLSPASVQVVSKALASGLPENSQAKIAKNIAAQTKKDNQKPNTKNPSKQKTDDEKAEELIKIIDESIDEDFIKFRADIFSLSSKYQAQEWGKLSNNESRLFLVKKITSSLRSDFPLSWKNLNLKSNYLTVGQNDREFFRNIQDVFRGADSADEIVTRLNARKSEKISADRAFKILAAELLYTIKNSSSSNTIGNKKFISQIITNNLAKKASKYTDFWREPLFIQNGYPSSTYLKDLTSALESSDSWENFSRELIALQSEFIKTEQEKREKAEQEKAKEKMKETVKPQTKTEPETKVESQSEDKNDVLEKNGKKVENESVDTNQDTTQEKQNEIIDLKGRIVVQGNEPHTYLAISTTDKNYKIIDEEKKYWDYQRKNVSIKAEILKKSSSELILSEIKILEISIIDSVVTSPAESSNTESTENTSDASNPASSSTENDENNEDTTTKTEELTEESAEDSQ